VKVATPNAPGQWPALEDIQRVTDVENRINESLSRLVKKINIETVTRTLEHKDENF
jgi:hypothetical protein